MLSNIVNEEGKLKSKLAITIIKMNNLINVQLFISLMDMFQLDFYLAIFLQLDSFEIRSNKSLVNIGAAVITLLVMVFTKIYLFFVSTRVASIREDKTKAEKSYKKYYYNFLFLNEDTDCANWYSKHQMILNLVKDPFLALFLVYASKAPLLQIGVSFLIMLVFFIAEVKTSPMLEKKENWRNYVSSGVYTVTILIFLIQVIIEDSLSVSQKEFYLGIPLIVSVSLLILSNYIISTIDTIKAIRKRCRVKKSKILDEQRAENTTAGESIQDLIVAGALKSQAKLGEKSNKVKSSSKKVKTRKRLKNSNKRSLKESHAKNSSKPLNLKGKFDKEMSLNESQLNLVGPQPGPNKVYKMKRHNKKLNTSDISKSKLTDSKLKVRKKRAHNSLRKVI